MERVLLFDMVMKLISSVLLACLLMIASCVSGKQTPLEDTRIKASDARIVYIGRINKSNPDAPLFTYPGVQVVAGFEGTSLRMVAKPKSGFYMAQVDENEAFKVDYLSKEDSVFVLAEGLADAQHTVKLMYAIEGYELRPEFYGFILDPGKDLTEAPALPQRKIEFIGNSITCGYGIEADVATAPFTYETENHYYSFASLTARALQAQHLVVARSGIGIFRNYNGPYDGTPEGAMPAVYDYTNYDDQSQLWDFTQYQPDLVCINLGTNDASVGRFNQQKMREAYASFLQHVRGNYPHAKIVMMSGCMLNSFRNDAVKAQLDAVVAQAQRRGDNQVYRFDFEPQDGSLGYGASYHPSLKQQEKMANELVPFLKEIMGW